MGTERATREHGGGAQAADNMGWGWKGCLCRDLPSLDAGKSFLEESEQEGAAWWDTP